MARKCVDACRSQFATDPNLTFFVNDGRSLDMVEDESVDFVFSLDSLLHAEAGVIEAYLQQLSRKLSPAGVGFLHHSNIGAFRTTFSAFARIPPWLHRVLERARFVDSTHWRSFSMTSERFTALAERAELCCIGAGVGELGDLAADRLLLNVHPERVALGASQ